MYCKWVLCNDTLRCHKIMSVRFLLCKKMLQVKLTYLVKFRVSVLIFILVHLELLMYPEKQEKCGAADKVWWTFYRQDLCAVKLYNTDKRGTKRHLRTGCVSVVDTFQEVNSQLSWNYFSDMERYISPILLFQSITPFSWSQSSLYSENQREVGSSWKH